jgi:ParB/RepB/Spo0J family partition protein
MISDTKRKSPKAKASSTEAVSTLRSRSSAAKESPVGSYVLPIYLESLERHPKNRQPSEKRVEELAESFAEIGQSEPIIVRRLVGDRYQILSGETRYLAAKHLDWASMLGRIVTCNDAEALEWVARGNANRADLNPIERAGLIAELCKPIGEGGSGLTREKAAKAVGLESAASASNLVRLLELPPHWRKVVASGDLPESFARLIVPYRDVPAIMESLCDEWSSDRDVSWSNAFDSRAELERTLESLVAEHTRPLEKVDLHYWQVSDATLQKRLIECNGRGTYPCLITLKELDDNRDGLRIRKLPVRIKGKTEEIECATNLKLFDQLQIEAIAARAERKAKAASKKSAATTGREVTERDDPLAAAKRKDQLDRAVARWRDEWLRSAIGRKIDAARIGKNDLLVWRGILSFLVDARADELRIGIAREFGSSSPYQGEFYLDIRKATDCGERLFEQARTALLQFIEGDNYSQLDAREIAAIADDWQVDRETAWQSLFRDQLGRERLTALFGSYRKDELIPLAKTLGVTLLPTQSKEQMVAVLVNRDTPLPMPAFVAAEKKREAKKRKS